MGEKDKTLAERMSSSYDVKSLSLKVFLLLQINSPSNSNPSNIAKRKYIQLKLNITELHKRHYTHQEISIKQHAVSVSSESILGIRHVPATTQTHHKGLATSPLLFNSKSSYYSSLVLLSLDKRKNSSLSFFVITLGELFWSIETVLIYRTLPLIVQKVDVTASLDQK